MGWLSTVRRIGPMVAVAAVVFVAGPAQAANSAVVDDGFVQTDFGGSWSAARGVAVQPDGRLVAAGYASEWDDEKGEYVDRFALARYNRDLSLDSSFSHDGRQLTNVDDDLAALGADVVLQADGKIVVAGATGRYPSSDFALVRYGADGSLDSSFSGDGIVTTDLGAFDRISAAAIQPDGKIVVVGESIDLDEPRWQVAVARYRTDGSLDPSFSGDGVMTTDLGDTGNGNAVAIQGDGKLVVGGAITWSGSCPTDRSTRHSAPPASCRTSGSRSWRWRSSPTAGSWRWGPTVTSRSRGTAPMGP